MKKHCLSHLTIFFQDLDKFFLIYKIIKKNRCPYMVINVNVHYNDGFLPEIILLTL